MNDINQNSSQPQPPVVVDGGSDVEKNKFMAAISYIWIVGLIMLLIKKDSPFVQWHAKQATVIFLASVVFSFIPILGWLANLILFVFAVVGFIGALQGKRTELPLIKDLAAKLNF